LKIRENFSHKTSRKKSNPKNYSRPPRVYNPRVYNFCLQTPRVYNR
jgi:hypothetical protein